MDYTNVPLMSRSYLVKFSARNTAESGIVSLLTKAQFQRQRGIWARTWIEGRRCMLSSRKQRTEITRAGPFEHNAEIIARKWEGAVAILLRELN